MKFTEAKLEEAFIELLALEGIPHVLGNTIDRQENEVLIKADLKAFLLSNYKSEALTSQEADTIIRKLQVFSASDLYESNKAIMQRLSDGFQFKREPSADGKSRKDLYVYLIDYSAADNNHYKLVSQLVIEGKHENRIPDAILYINGLPLVVFEFKSAIRIEATCHEAYTQITTRYQWARVLLSNSVSVPIDNAIFAIGAFGWLLPWAVVWEIFIFNLIVKYGMTLLSLPLIYLVPSIRSSHQ